MPIFSNVGQGAYSGSCGYFCGYLLGQIRQHPTIQGQWQMSQAAVIAARNSFTGGSGERFLWAHQAPDFLRTVQAPLYQYYEFRNRRGETNADYLYTVVNRALRSGSGVMLLFGGGTGQALGHWCAILYKTGPDDQNANWCWYDPMGPTFSGIAPGREIATDYYSHVTFYVVG